MTLVEQLRSLEPGQLRLATKGDLAGFEFNSGDVCHDHAARWVALHPGHSVVRGFLVIVNDSMFNKHSVIDTGRELLDITPRPDNESRKLLNFVEFDGGSPAIFVGLPNQVP